MIPFLKDSEGKANPSRQYQLMTAQGCQDVGISRNCESAQDLFWGVKQSGNDRATL